MDKRRKSLMDQCDHLWSQIVKLKNYGCSIFNEHPIVPMLLGLHPHHIITRANKRLRWDTDNGIPVTAQQHRAIHDGKIIVPVPEDLQLKSCQVADTSIENLKAIRDDLKKQLKERRARYEEYWDNH